MNDAVLSESPSSVGAPQARLSFLAPGIVTVVASLLFAAATLKAAALIRNWCWFPESVAVGDVLSVLFIGVIESTTGILLVRCWRRRGPWLLAAVVFALFFAVTIWRTLSGVFRCGCFGDAAVSTHTMAFVDGGLAFLLFLCLPQDAGWEGGSTLVHIGKIDCRSDGSLACGCPFCRRRRSRVSTS